MAERTGVRAVTEREIGRIRGGRIAWCLLFFFPVLSLLILVGVFRQRVPSELPIAVCDQDGTALSRRLVRMVDATRTMRVALRAGDPAEGMRSLQAGAAYAVVLLPRGLERDVRRGTGAEVVAWTEGQWLLAESLICTDLQRVVGTASAGVEVRVRERRGDVPAAAVVHLEPIRTQRHALYNPNLNYLVYLLPGLLPAMLQILIMMAAVQALGSELRGGTAGEWVRVAGGRPAKAVLGKLLPYAAHYLVVCLGTLALLPALFGVPWRGSVVWIGLATAAFVLACLAAALALVAWTANLRLATSLASFYAGPAFAFSGMTFPMAGMPLVGRVWGGLLPLTHYVRVLVDQGIRGGSTSVATSGTAALLVLAAVAGGVSTRRLGRIATDPRYWERP